MQVDVRFVESRSGSWTLPSELIFWLQAGIGQKSKIRMFRWFHSIQKCATRARVSAMQYIVNDENVHELHCMHVYLKMRHVVDRLSSH